MFACCPISGVVVVCTFSGNTLREMYSGFSLQHSQKDVLSVFVNKTLRKDVLSVSVNKTLGKMSCLCLSGFMLYNEGVYLE